MVIHSASASASFLLSTNVKDANLKTNRQFYLNRKTMPLVRENTGSLLAIPIGIRKALSLCKVLIIHSKVSLFTEIIPE